MNVNSKWTGIVAHAFNSSTWKVEAGNLLRVPDYPGQHIETLSQKIKNEVKLNI